MAQDVQLLSNKTIPHTAFTLTQKLNIYMFGFIKKLYKILLEQEQLCKLELE